MRVAVTGATGFIGTHLSRYLEAKGYEVVKVEGDLRERGWEWQLHGCDQVYALAANMGGRDFISRAAPIILADNVRIALSTVEAARSVGARLLFVSTACVYPEMEGKLDERQSFPAWPDEYYGWSKLFGELAAMTYAATRIVRLDSIYGMGERWRGGREKVIPALCRKVAEAKRNRYDRIPVYGDGSQTRCFLHVKDLVRVLHDLIWVDYEPHVPVNVGGDGPVSVNGLVGIISGAAGYKVKPDPKGGPTGSLHRQLSLARLHEKLPNWKPKVTLTEGISEEYLWIERMMKT